MKVARMVLILAIFSMGIAGIFHSTSGVTIKATWYDKLAEIVIIAIPVFIVLLVAYIIGKTIFKTAVGIKKKGLPKEEGPKN